MKTFERLNKNEMKMIVGGTDKTAPGGCNSECSNNGMCSAGYECSLLICSSELNEYVATCTPIMP